MNAFDKLSIEDLNPEEDIKDVPTSVFEAETRPYIPLDLIGDVEDDDFPW